MTNLDARCLLLLLLLACAAVDGQNHKRHTHRLDLRPVLVHRSQSLDETVPHHLLDLSTPNKQMYHSFLDPPYVGKYPPQQFTFDDLEFNRRCLPCPGDVKIVAKRKSLTAAFGPPQLESTCSSVPENNVVVQINSGPVVGEQLGPGAYQIFITMIHYGSSPPLRAAQCNYTYEVIVNRCSPLNAADKMVKVVCARENAWGSHCTFSCPSGYQRRGFAKTRCKDDLTWSHDVPRCRLRRRGPCKLTAFNGVFECTNGEDLESNDYVSSGTVCRLSCEEGSYIPRRQQRLANIKCFRGRWNSTADPACVPIPRRAQPMKSPRRVNKPRYAYKKKGAVRGVL